MEYEDFEIGDRVGRFYGNIIEKATIIDIQDGLYLLKFDNKEYENLLCDNEKLFKINESWDINKTEDIETPKEIVKFLNEIDNICKKYNFSISHEDSHGAFILEKYDDYNIKWLKDCMLNLK